MQTDLSGRRRQNRSPFEDLAGLQCKPFHSRTLFIHQHRVKEDGLHYLHEHLKFKCTDAIYFRIKPLKMYLNSIKISRVSQYVMKKMKERSHKIFISCNYNIMILHVHYLIKKMYNLLNVKPWNTYFELLRCKTIVTCKKRNYDRIFTDINQHISTHLIVAVLL